MDNTNDKTDLSNLNEDENNKFKNLYEEAIKLYLQLKNTNNYHENEPNFKEINENFELPNSENILTENVDDKNQLKININLNGESKIGYLQIIKIKFRRTKKIG